MDTRICTRISRRIQVDDTDVLLMNFKRVKTFKLNHIHGNKVNDN